MQDGPNEPINTGSSFIPSSFKELKRGIPDEIAKQPLKDAAAVNSTRWQLFEELKQTGLPIEVGTGGLTKYNRCHQNLPKTHWLDAACVGKSTPEKLIIEVKKPLIIKAKGHGTRKRCRPNKYGFPIGHAPKAKLFQGFQTGDIVKAVIPKGKFAGTYVGRIAIRFRPCFRLTALPKFAKANLVRNYSVEGLKPFDVHPKYLRIIHHADGYEYST